MILLLVVIGLGVYAVLLWRRKPPPGAPFGPVMAGLVVRPSVPRAASPWRPAGIRVRGGF